MDRIIDGLQNTFNLIFLVALFIAFPLFSISMSYDKLTESQVYQYTDTLVQTICANGALTRKDYESYVKQVAAFGNSYEITIEHMDMVYYPDPDNIGEVIVDQVGYYNDDIINGRLLNVSLPLDQQVYLMDNGDTFKITITKTSKTKAEGILSVITNTSHDYPTYIKEVGGVIRNDHN